MRRAAIRAVGVRFGAETRDNAYYRERFPELIEGAQQKSLARAFSSTTEEAAQIPFDVEMARYTSDPFRGALSRRILGPGESPLTLEIGAAQDALAAAHLTAADVDLILCASWLPNDFVAPGDAIWIAEALGVHAPAWNIESACSSGLVCLQTAHSLIASEQFKRVLVVMSSTNSRHVAVDDTLGWISSDGAAACILEPARPGEDDGVLAAFSRNTAETCGVFLHALTTNPNGHAVVQMQVGQKGSKALRESVGPELVRRCCDAAADKAGVRLDEIKFFAFNTPLAWFSSLCVNALGVTPDRTINLFPRFANLGAPYPAINMFFGAHEGKLSPGDLVMIYTVGSVSSAGALVLRWGDVALGPLPPL
jgi:3-oxoacyl-[acyl-carrier-protein] synthase-3